MSVRFPSRHAVVRLLRVQGVSASGQLLAAAQLAAMLAVVGTNRATDAFLLLFSGTQLVMSVVVFGVLQPLVLSKPGYAGWSRWRLVAALANIPVVTATAAYLVLAADYPDSAVWGVAIVLAGSGVLAGFAGVNAVNLAMLGRPEFAAGLTTLPNALAAIAVLTAPSAPVTYMSAGLLAGNLVVALATRIALSNVKRSRATKPAETRGIPLKDITALSATALVGAGGPFLLQAVVSSYPPGDATILGIIVRFGSGILTVGITAFAMTVTDWSRRSDRPLRAAAGAFTAGHAVTGIVAAGWIATASGSGTTTAIVAGVFWLFGASSQALATRAVGLAGRYSLFARGAAYGLLAYPLAATALRLAEPSATTFLMCLGMLASGANLVFLRGLAWRTETRVALGGAGVVVAALSIAVAGS